MKRKNREINIFSMSALDLFASALGAFILLTVVIFPYFPNTGMAEQAALDEAFERLQAAAGENEELQQIHADLDAAVGALRQELEHCLVEQDRCQTDLEEALTRVHQCERQLGDRDALVAELEACRAEADSQQAQIDAQQAQIGGQQAQIDGLQAQIESQQVRIDNLERRKFILVTISWDGGRGDDVDLHVIDPHGNEYYYGARSHLESDARFEEDSLHGPGNEVWLQPEAIPGRYEIHYNPFGLASSSVDVRGRIVHPLARHEFRIRQLRDGEERQLVATIVVDEQGNLTVNEP